ncbi:MAG: DUF4337 family protein [Candidatus Nanopelagicales bacterium]
MSIQSEEKTGPTLTQGTLAIIAAILLGLAAVFTAWSAFRASLTGDLVLKNYSEQQATIALATDTYGRADQQETLEISLFLEYVVAASAGNVTASDYLETVMTEELFAAVSWWLEEPDETSPPTPFDVVDPYFADLPSQVLVVEGDALIEEADALRAAAEEADAVSDRFDLANVFFAVVLFIAGLTTIVQRRSIQLAFLGLSVVGLIAGAAVMVTTPGWLSLS